MPIPLIESSLVLLIGASGSGKAAFAARHFSADELLPMADIGGGYSVALQQRIIQRLRERRLTVVVSAQLLAAEQQEFWRLAKQAHVPLLIIVLEAELQQCLRQAQAGDPGCYAQVWTFQHRETRRHIAAFRPNSYRALYVLDPQAATTAVLQRQQLAVNQASQSGPFDLIGDVHGCFDELLQLLERLGYQVHTEAEAFRVTAPAGRRVIFLGDVVDRGPASHRCLRLVMDMVADGVAYCVMGNHEIKLLNKLRGKAVKVRQGLAETLAQLATESDAFIERVKAFLSQLCSHLVLDAGRLVAAHAGMKAHYQGRDSDAVRAFGAFGETRGELDGMGLPIRYPWARDYRGAALVVYGHTPVTTAEFINNTLCIDTGCVFGGALTALRYPELQLLSVPAARSYYSHNKLLVSSIASEVEVK